MIHRMEEETEADLRENLLAKLFNAIREKGVRSTEAQGLKLEYRNLDLGIRLGIL
jgi:hypothetical protein